MVNVKFTSLNFETVKMVKYPACRLYPMKAIVKSPAAPTAMGIIILLIGEDPCKKEL